MPALYEDTLLAARTLLDGDKVGGFARRRAVSSAYYALFQRLCALVAGCMSRADVDSSEYRRAFRVLDHRQCREYLNRNAEFKTDLGVPFAELQDIRQWADYSIASHPDDLVARSGSIFPLAEAESYYRKASAAIAFVGSLELARQIRLMVTLVIRDRP